jgi:RimJ/RimL family protein N-acetyltransferase
MPSFPPLEVPLSSDLVALRPEEERDIPEILIAHQEDPELFVRLGLERPPSGAQLGRRIEEAEDRRADGSGVRFSVLSPGDDTCRGQVDVHRVDWDHRRAEAGIWIAPGQRGRGLAAAALALLGRWLFERCGLQRLELLTEPDNTRMVSAARRAGFVQEGILRAYVRERGRRLDVMVLSLLPSDLEAAR